MFEDFDLIVASFLSQYGIRIYSNDFKSMKWDEFKALIGGLSADTPLGNIVQIRAEDNKDTLNNFSREQRRIRSEWRNRKAQNMNVQDVDFALDSFKNMFVKMAGDS